MDGNGQHRDSDGYVVNSGNFDDNGLNVNNSHPGDRYSSFGVSAARQSYLYPSNRTLPSIWREELLLSLFLGGFDPSAQHLPDFI